MRDEGYWEKLRGLAHGEASAKAWAELCGLLEQEPSDAEVVLEYAAGLVSAWSAAVRPAPAAWMESAPGSWLDRCRRALAGSWVLFHAEGFQGEGPYNGPVHAWMDRACGQVVVVDAFEPHHAGAGVYRYEPGRREVGSLIPFRDYHGYVTDNSYRARDGLMAIGGIEVGAGQGCVWVVDVATGEERTSGGLSNDRLREMILGMVDVDELEVEEAEAFFEPDVDLYELTEQVGLDLDELDHLDDLVCVALLDEGDVLVATSRLDGTLQRVTFGAAGEDALDVLGVHGEACGVVALAGGRCVTVGMSDEGEPSLRLWDAARGRLLAEVEVPDVGQLAVSPEGARLVVWGERAVVVGVEGEHLEVVGEAVAARGAVESMAVAWPKGGPPLGAVLNKGRLKVFDVLEGAVLLDAKVEGVECFGFGEDPWTLITASRERATAWRLGPGQRTARRGKGRSGADPGGDRG